MIEAVYALYRNTDAMVTTSDGPTEQFPTSSGVLQGDSLAPFVFIIIMDWIIRTAIPDDSRGFILERRRSTRYPEKRLSILAYADDLVLLASDMASAQGMLCDLVNAASRVGLQINVKKTEVLSIPTCEGIQILYPSSDGSQLPLSICKSFKYLGGTVPSTHEDFLHRRALAWAALNKLRPVWTATNLSDRLRSRLFKALIDPVLLYNAESWIISDSFLKTLDQTHAGLL